MSQGRKGIRVPLSPARTVAVEFLRHAQSVPALFTSRHCRLGAIVRARNSSPNRPSWSAIMMKAFGLVAQRRPELRRSFVRWPIPHLYEHPTSECAVLVERELDGEPAVLGGKIRGPENRSVAEIDAALRRFQTEPAESIGEFRQVLRLGRLPAIVRRFVFWHSIHLSGYWRAKRFGTFMLSTLGDLGAEQGRPMTFLTTYFSFGPISPDGSATLKLIYDHRVTDDRPIARALIDIEDTLNGEVAAELSSIRLQAA